MRYKFRGKRLDNGEWVHGDLMTGKNPSITWWKPTSNDSYEIDCADVDPLTVGQYTGLEDKNGKDIYEGDIVCARYGNFYIPIFRNGIYMAYNVQYLHHNAEPSTQFNVVWKEGCEVIGNKYDNPELLGG